MRLKIFLILIFLTSYTATSKERFRGPVYEDFRWLGRGNTGVAIVNDASAMFYNPAGLGRQGRYAFDFINSGGGISKSAWSNSNEIAGISGSDKTLSDQFAPFLGEPIGLKAQFMPAFAVPFLGFGGYLTLDARAEYRNPVSPEFSMNERDDAGLIAGVGIPILPNLYLGVSGRWFRRRTIISEVSGATLISMNTDSIADLARKGTGYGFNVGMQYDHPLSEFQALSFGVAVEDLGHTTIRAQNGRAPLDQDQAINFGLAYTFNTEFIGAKLLFDVRNLGEGDYYATGKMLYQGVELNFLKMDLRAGLYQGYWTAGLSIRWLPIFRIDLSTYAEELDSNMGFRGNRMYMLGINAGVLLEHTSRKKQKYTLDHL